MVDEAGRGSEVFNIMRSEPYPLEVFLSMVSVSSAQQMGSLRTMGLVEEAAFGPVSMGSLAGAVKSWFDDIC